MGRKRKQGEGTLRLRKDGRWEGRVVTGYNEKGLPITKSVTSVSKAECQRKLDELKASLGVLNGRAKPEMPFGEWVDLWYQTWSKPGLRITTQQAYEDRIYKHIIPGIGSIPLCKLTQGDLQQFYAELKRNGRVTRREQNGPGLSDRMVRSCHATCRMALEKAKTEGLILSNPAAGCKLPPTKKKEMQVLTGEEMQRFLIQAKEDGFYEMMLLELATGMRRGEICALQWDDLNLRSGELQIQRQVIHVAGELRVSSPKTKNSERVVILPPGVVKVLKELRDRTDSRWMFPSPVKEDAPLDPQSAYRKMKKALQRAGCKNLRFHDLRHTFATMALEHGMDVKTLSAVIGHVSSTTTLDVYSHITGAMQLQAAQNIERVIGHSEAYEPHETLEDRLPTDEEMEATRPKFSPYTGKIRKPGTGGLYELNDHLYEGRYSPTNAQGKREVHTVYAKTREEAEALLEQMIREVRARIDAEKAALKAEQAEQPEAGERKG